MKMDHTRYLSARLHAALTLFDPGSATGRGSGANIKSLAYSASQCGLTIAVVRTTPQLPNALHHTCQFERVMQLAEQGLVGRQLDIFRR